MTKLFQRHCQAIGRDFYLRLGVVLFAVLSSLAVTGISAQEPQETCPCFSTAEVESLIQRINQMTWEDGETMCKAEDFSVELSAELTIWDTSYSLLAQASVKWFDFDPGACNYIDKPENPGVERSESWPHPAPEATARLCYDIITSVIAKLNTAGKCITM